MGASVIGHGILAGTYLAEYRDCKCTWQMLSHINPNCEYLTLKDEWIAKKRKHSDDDGGKKACLYLTKKSFIVEVFASQ